MNFSPSVLLLPLLLGCTTPSKEPVGSAAPPPAEPAVASAPSASASPAAATVSAHQGPKATSSAYPGCGQAIPVEKLWDETTEAEVLDAIGEAKACAAQHGRRLLLEFVAPWCDDCQEMAKLEASPAVAQTLSRRFERVRVNVGKWDRHEALRQSFGVRALATYVVLEPKTSQQLAKTTLEPVTKPGQKLTAEDWRRWLERY